MTITLCNSHPFTFYLPFHTSLRADQCPIHVPSTCTLGLDPCARHSLFGRTDPYYIDNFFSSCDLKRPAATLASPLLCNCTVLPVPLSTGPYLDPQPHRHSMLVPTVSAPRVTRCSLGKYWSHDWFRGNFSLTQGP